MTWLGRGDIVNNMDEGLKNFLVRFAELERRVRRLAAEDRGLREEVKQLRSKLELSEAEARALREMLNREQARRRQAAEEVGDLIERLSALRKGGGAGAAAGEET